MTNRMPVRTTELVQTRMSNAEVRQLDRDSRVLGLASRSEAVRRAITLLHQQARDAELAQSYDDFYDGLQAPLGAIAAVGDAVAADTITERG